MNVQVTLCYLENRQHAKVATALPRALALIDGPQSLSLSLSLSLILILDQK